jgi:hypothetical protein
MNFNGELVILCQLIFDWLICSYFYDGKVGEVLSSFKILYSQLLVPMFLAIFMESQKIILFRTAIRLSYFMQSDLLNNSD